MPAVILAALFTGLHGGTSAAASRGNIEILQIQVNSADNALPVNERDIAWLKFETAPYRKPDRLLQSVAAAHSVARFDGRSARLRHSVRLHRSLFRI